MSSRQQSFPGHILPAAGEFYAEVASSEYVTPDEADNLRKVLASDEPEIHKIWQRVEALYPEQFNEDTADFLSPKILPGDGQQWLCRAIMAAQPEPYLRATTHKEAEQWQKDIYKKVRELELLIADQPAACSGLFTQFANDTIAHIESDPAWRGRDALLSDKSALRSALARFRILLDRFKKTAASPDLIPENFDFEVRPNRRTASRNGFIRALTDEIQATLGNRKHKWVAEIAACIYGGAADPKEVKRQVSSS